MIIKDNRVITFGQLNIAKMSVNSEMAVDKYIATQKIMSFAIQETGNWVPKTELFPGKKVFTNTSSDSVGLYGVALILHDTMRPEPISELLDTEVDAVWAKICMGNKKILVGSVYCRPSEKDMQHFNNLLKHITLARDYYKKQKFHSILIYGDFNARHHNWGDHVSNKKGKLLQQYIEKEELTLCSPFDLTFTGNNGGSVIDLVLCEGPVTNILGSQWIDKETEFFSGAPILGHYPVLQNFAERNSSRKVTNVVKDWKETNWKKWTNEVEAKLSTDCSPSCGEAKWSQFLDTLKDAINDHVPNKTVSIHSKPYWNEKLTELSNHCLGTRRQYQKRATPRNSQIMKEAVENFKLELIRAKNIWIRKRVENINIKNSILFWKRYKRVFGAVQENYISNLKDQNVIYTSIEEKEEILFDTFFTGKHIQDDEDNTSNDKTMEEYEALFQGSSKNIENNQIHDKPNLNTDISLTEISEAIRKQYTVDKAIDIDGIHPLLLCKLGERSLCELQNIFNWALENGVWLWKTARVTFIRKNGKSDYTDPGAYRPISIASYFGKVLERILDKRLKNHIIESSQLDDDQEGFLESRSTSRYLFRLLCNLTEIRRRKLVSIILFLDFEKAFDSVDLHRMVIKLSRFGVSGKILLLLQSFLFERNVKLRVNGNEGQSRQCTKYGLPQGSALSPLLFILYITDMRNKFNAHVLQFLSCLKFADDGTLLVVHENLIGCHKIMQEICDLLSEWCLENKLVINCQINKTEAIILKTANPSYSDIIPELVISGKRIKYVKSTKVLGVILDEDLSFTKHASQKINECCKKWGLLTKATNRNHGFNVYSLTLLFKTMILTKLHYAAPIWLGKHIEKLNKFWNRIIMKISGAMLNPHRELVELALHLPPPEIQLEILTTKFVSKCLTAEDHMSSLIFQAEGSLQKELHGHIKSIKNFVAWKNGSRKSSRSVDITTLTKSEVFYTTEEIQNYQQKIWLDRIKNRIQLKSHTSDNDVKVINIINCLQSNKVTLDKENFLFSFNTTKAEDSIIMDFIHTNSSIFGNTRQRLNLTTSATCEFCNIMPDSPEHQLFNCSHTKSSTRDDLDDYFPKELQQDYVPTVLTSKDKKLQETFIKQVIFLKEKLYFEEAT